MSKLEKLIDEIQEKSEVAEVSGDNETFELLDTGAYYLRDFASLLKDTIPYVENGTIQCQSQKLLRKIKNILEA